ncbi:uncharacterized protein LOC129104941 [Anoplopoma fimbria]|uniref:uncharacterized protein LOC129104941 n=1 Tax=Anoplopoma fimbria TaxID=229290 RepID=UPI0023EB9748|nr:uncharacterized protein LOC129104941 [Anoplopoma fimbria]
MESVQILQKEFQSYFRINGSQIILSIVTTGFYIYCMVRPLHGKRFKQPLKLLLGTLIGSTISYLVSIIATLFSILHGHSMTITHIIHLLVVCSVCNSMTSSVWLNFFYCSQIVPARRALFIWMKKNVKSIIYCIWVTERIYSLLALSIMFFLAIPRDGFKSSNDSTVVYDVHVRDFWKMFPAGMFDIVFHILKAHFILCLCVMVNSSGSIVFYLSGHMRRMAANGQPLSCPKLRNQLRVAVTGILQGVLYVICSMWTLHRSFPGGGLYMISGAYTYFTVINLYMLGTLFNLGAGQAVFRQRAAHIWLRATQCCKAPQEQPSEQGV